MKPILTLLTTLCMASVLSAQTSGDAVLKRLATAVGSLSPYRIDFTVSSPDSGSASGFFIVDGVRYRMEIDGEQQFSDGEYVYGVSTLNSEVLIDVVQLNSRNILVNPSRAFDLVGDGLTASRIVAEDAASVVIEVVPSDEVLLGIDKIRVEVDARSGLPRRLTYDFGGTELAITVERIATVAADKELFVFDRAHYQAQGYEITDFSIDD